MAKKTKKLHPGGFLGKARTRDFLRAQRKAARNFANARRQQMMPTAGMSQGRPAIGRTPMPGPAPDAARTRRMQQLMRQQQARFNAIQKARSMQNQGNSRMATAPVQMMNNLPAAVRRAMERGQGFTNQQLLDAVRFPSRNRRKKPARNQLLVNKISNRRKNKPRTTGLPDAKFS